MKKLFGGSRRVVWKSWLFGCFGCLVAELCGDLVLVGYQGGLYTLLTTESSHRALTELEDCSSMLLRYASRCQNRSGSCWRWSGHPTNLRAIPGFCHIRQRVGPTRIKRKVLLLSSLQFAYR
jgi:hypothetical protein